MPAVPKLGHRSVFSHVTAAIEFSTMLDLQGHTSVTLTLEKLSPGLACCVPFSWFNLTVACSFLLIFLKAAATSAVALTQVTFPKFVKH